MDCVEPSAFLAWIETLRKTKKAIQDAAIGTKDEITSSDLSFESGDEEAEDVAENIKSEVTWEPCVTTKTKPNRLLWIEQEVNPSDINSINFCDTCCTNLASADELGKCKEECNGAYIPEEVSSDKFDKCFSQPDDFHSAEKIVDCQKCIETAGEGVDPNQITILMRKCEDM